MGNISLDIFIGLVFVYLLYSLLTSLLVEILATNLGFRARNLKLAIIRMLSDTTFSLTTALKFFWSRKLPHQSDDLAHQFYQSPLIKYLSSGSFHTKPSAVSSAKFVDGLISVIGKGEKNQVENIQDYFAEGSKAAEKGGDTFEQLKFYYEDAQKDLEKFKENLATWYEEMMERARGWYKKRIQIILFLVGLILVTTFNVDTFAITAKLSKDDKARAYFVEAAAKVNTPNSTLSDTTRYEQAMDSLFKEAFETQEILSLSRCNISGEENCSCSSCGFWNKYLYSSFLNFLGCLISALAISLGAPFWYDLLNKLMKFRTSVSSSGTSSSENKSTRKDSSVKIKG